MLANSRYCPWRDIFLFVLRPGVRSLVITFLVAAATVIAPARALWPQLPVVLVKPIDTVSVALPLRGNEPRLNPHHRDTLIISGQLVVAFVYFTSAPLEPSHYVWISLQEARRHSRAVVLITNVSVVELPAHLVGRVSLVDVRPLIASSPGLPAFRRVYIPWAMGHERALVRR